jgi:hypothetical protein
MRRLDSRGISHIALPLAAVVILAVAGTFAMVAKRANTTDLSSASTAVASTKKKTTTKKGYLLVFSQSGRYSKVKIQLANPGSTAHTCGGALTANNSYTLTKNLPKKVDSKAKTISYPAARYSCTSTNGSESYQVSLGKGSTFIAAQSVDVEPGYCTMVRWNPAQATKTKYVDGHCEHSESVADAPAKIDPQVNVKPALTVSQKSIKGYVEVITTGEIATRPMCSGQVSIKFTDMSPGASNLNPNRSSTVTAPLKLAGNVVNRLPYCVAVISSKSATNIASGKTYSVSADFTGNAFLNAASGSAPRNLTIK